VPVEISIVVPVFNELDNIAPLAAEVARSFAGEARSWELVLVDDSSTDATWAEILKAQAADSRVRGLRHQSNRGQSAAVWTGITGSEGSILCTLDGDLQNNPADLPRMIAMLDQLDFVSGRRTERQDSWVRKMSSSVARAARTWALGHDFADTGCALRAFKRSALQGVFPFNGVHRFLPILVAAGGNRCLEIPVSHRPRVAGVSKYCVWNRLGRGIYDLIGVGWCLRRRLAPVAVVDSRAAR
jgi:dolichol-phosphate mannosyltransferase